MDLTIVIATADRPRLLRHSVESVLAAAAAAASVVRTRLLVVDDSDDRTAEPVASGLGVGYAPNPIRDPRRNPSAARAWAIDQVETDLIALFDDDDEMLDDHIVRLARQVLDGAEICSTGYWYAMADPADPTMLHRTRRQLVAVPHLGDMLAGVQPVNDGAMMRTDVARSVAWEADRENLMMYHVWLQLLVAGRKFATTGAATFLYRQHPSSLSHTLDDRNEELLRALLDEYREIARSRFGTVPGPSISTRLRVAAGRARRLVRDRAGAR